MVETRARELFAPLGPSYDRCARLLSFGQDPVWRQFLVSRVDAGADDVVLDVAAGTGAVALELVRQHGCSVVGVDQSPEMLAEARRRIASAAQSNRIRLVEASAERLPFDDASFDGLTAAYCSDTWPISRPDCESSRAFSAQAHRSRCSTSAFRRGPPRAPFGTSTSGSVSPPSAG